MSPRSRWMGSPGMKRIIAKTRKVMASTVGISRSSFFTIYSFIALPLLIQPHLLEGELQLPLVDEILDVIPDRLKVRGRRDIHPVHVLQHVPQQLFVALLPLRFRGGELDLPVHVIDLLVAAAGDISRRARLRDITVMVHGEDRRQIF